MALDSMPARLGTEAGTGAGDAREIARLRCENHGPTVAPDYAFRRQVRALHACGLRAVGELLGEVAASVPAAASVIAERLEVYGRLDLHTVAWLGADGWLGRRDLIRTVGGRL